MSDLISRQAAIDAINTWDKFGVDERSRVVRWHEGLEPYVHLRDVVAAIGNLPSAQPDVPDTNVGDMISKQATITEFKNYERDSTAPIDYVKIVEQMPSAQPDARYINANELIKRLQQAGLDDAVSIAVKMAGHERLKHMPSAQPEQRYTEEELRVFQHGISLSLLSKRSSQHWQYDEDTATEIKFLERLYEKVVADMRGEQDG